MKRIEVRDQVFYKMAIPVILSQHDFVAVVCYGLFKNRPMETKEQIMRLARYKIETCGTSWTYKALKKYSQHLAQAASIVARFFPDMRGETALLVPSNN